MAFPLNFTLSNLTNLTTKVMPILSNPSNIPSFTVVLIMVFLLVLLLKLGLIALDSLISFLKRFIVPIVLFGVAYLMAILYYIPTYAPKVFVYYSNNTTTPNKIILSDLKEDINFILIPVFYDKLLYYQTMYNRPLDEVLVSFMILLVLFIYLTHFVFWKYLDIYSVILTSMLFFIITLGLKGVIAAAIHYDVIKMILIGYCLVYSGLILLRLKIWESES